MMDLPKWKPNRLPDFDYSTPGAYSITICTQDRKEILSQIVGDRCSHPPKNQQGRKHRAFHQNIDRKRNWSAYFQRSYYDHVIRNQQDYNEIGEHIDNNPARWKEDHFQEE